MTKQTRDFIVNKVGIP